MLSTTVRAPALRPQSLPTQRIATVPVKPFGRQLVQQRRQQSQQVVCNGLFGLGLPELAVIAGVAALIFGPSKLPELGKGLGKTVKSFQGAAKEFERELKEASASAEEDVKKADEQLKK